MFFLNCPNTGWVGIKDDSLVILQRQEIKRWWIQQWCNFKSLFTLAYVKGLFPKKESSFILWGIYCIVTGFLALCFMQKAYLFPYIYWHMAVMGMGTIILIYPSFEIYQRKPNWIYAIWPMILFGLFFVSSIQFLKLGHYSPMVCALLISNLAASTLFFSIKVSTGLFVGALLLYKFICSSPILPYCDILVWQNNFELTGAVALAIGSIVGFSIYKYLYEKAEKKFKIIDLSRIYERRLSLEAIYNQVNWDRLDPTYGSALLKDMSDRLKEPFQYFLDKKEAKLGEVLSLTRSGLYKFSNLLLQRIKEERRFHLNANDIKPVVIDPVIFKVRGDIHGLDEPMQLLLYNQATQQTLQADPELFERLLAINLLAISKSEQALDATVTLTIVDTTLKYYYQDVNQEKDSLSEKLDALAFCMSTSAHPEHILSTYQVDDMPTTVFLPKTASKLYQVESRHIVQAHGGYVEITETEEKLVCLYILPIAGKRFMRLKTYDPVDLDREVAETPESLAQEKELVLLVTKKTSLTKEEVEKTIAFIKKAHGLTRRKSGEPYYTHPMAVAKILLEVTKDPEVILAGLLHDIVEDTLVTLEQIELLYGKQVAYLVDMVTHYNTHGYRFLFAQYIIEDMLSNCKDIRVVYIKLADRLHNMRTIGFRNKEDQERIARETACFHIRWGAKYNENNELSPWISELKSICRQRIQPGLLPLIEQ